MAGPRPEIRKAGLEIGGMSRLRRRVRRAEERKWKVHNAEWVDPYPGVLGTFPEKLVFAWLADRHIPFHYQYLFPDWDESLTVEEYRADFALEWCKVIIEVQGEYWHSTPEAVAHDAWKFAAYEGMGWTPYDFWESQILTNLADQFARIPQLRGHIELGDYIVGRNVDDLAGLRARNAATRRPPALGVGRR